MPTWTNDLRAALRVLRKNPTFTAVALTTLALGIGANTAIFSVLRGVLLAPLAGTEQVVRVWPQMPVSTEFFEHFRTDATSYEALALHRGATFALRGEGRPEEVAGALVTPAYFRVFGIAPGAGRFFAPEESTPSGERVAVLGHGLWQRRFGGDEAVLGATIGVNGQEHTVIGVLPASYEPFDEQAELWLPLVVDPGVAEHWDMISYALLGRLRPEVSRQRAAEALRAAIASYGEQRPGYLVDQAGRADVTTLHAYLTDGVRAPLWALFAAVGCVLLVACANVANLQLARISGRHRELALRSALGAGRRRLAGQVLVESLVLALLGGALGLLVAAWTLAILVDKLPASMPGTAAIGPDFQVLAFTFMVALATGGLCGLLPALRAAYTRLGGALRGSGGTFSGRTAGVERQRLHRTLIAAEVALAVVLVLGAGLLSKNFAALLDTDPGFKAAGLLTLQLKPSLEVESEEARRAWFRRLIERVQAVPGVEAAALVNRLPMTGSDVGLAFRLADDDPDAGHRSVSVRLTTPDFVETLGIPLRRGRALQATDHTDAPPVGLVNESLARELWGERDPVGERLVFDTGELWFTVVGVVGDIHQHRLDQAPKPQVYRPLAQAAWEARMALVVRGAGDVAGLLPALEEAVWDVDPLVPISGAATMEQLIHRSLHDSRLLTVLFALFAGLALILAAVGVFGVTSYVVNQRIHENGVRLALGATAAAVIGTTLRRALVPVALGLGVGCVVARFALRSLAGFLSAVEVSDPWVYALVPLLLATVAALAAWIPARRASLADPMAVLKAE